MPFADMYKERGAKGGIAGPNTTAPDTKVMVKFPNNKSAVGCLVAELSRSWPPDAKQIKAIEVLSKDAAFGKARARMRTVTS